MMFKYSNMRRKLFLGFAIFVSTCNVSGQVAKWLIPPMYDDIHMASGENVIITDSLDNKIIWTLSGKRLAVTSDQVFPFKEGYAVTLKKGSSSISGFYDRNGSFVPLSGCSATYSRPYFSNNYLLVQEGYFYRFVNNKGELSSGQYAKAYPFANGYASCNTFANIQKRKDPYNLLLTTENEKISFSYDRKLFDDDDIEFISSVNDEQVGIVVAKHRLYYFNGKDKSLSPVFAQKDETNIKNQAKLEDDISLCISNESDSVSVLKAKCGKNNRIQIRFDALLVPISITLDDGEYIYKKKAQINHSFESSLRMINNGGKYGISWGDKEILPPQLDNLIACYEDKAFVRLSGKCGMIQVLKDEEFKITINKGNPIDFRHQKYETTIRLDLPKIISSHNTRIEIDPKSGCDVDMPSGEKKDTEFGNFIQYNCVLSIPKLLPDEMYNDSRNEITYPTQIVYDGLKSPVIPFKVKAWHYKYFNVDVNDSETSIHQGSLSFTFNINAERNPGEAVYPTSVNIQTDSLQCELEKISETRYKCKVLALNEGTNNIVVQILEDGCPPASFPFEVTYTKPSARTRNKPAVKEDVVIKKKTKVLPTPHLDI